MLNFLKIMGKRLMATENLNFYFFLLEPRGLSYGLVIVFQLHPLFITKVDRAYSVRCFYMEADKLVSSFLDVSMISTDVVTAGHAMPQCMYVLHADSPNGPTVRYARVGEKVWHVWDCPSDVYSMLVHSCFVTDGQGNQIQVIDENGCGVDQYVIRTPIYSQDVTRAQQETHVFKFADRVQVQFNCQIKLCFRGEGCQGITPPICPDSSHIESSENIIQTTEVDVQVTTLRLEESEPSSTPLEEVSTYLPQTTLETATTGYQRQNLEVLKQKPQSVKVPSQDVTFNGNSLAEELTSESLVLVPNTSVSSPPPIPLTTTTEEQNVTDVEGSGEGPAIGEAVEGGHGKLEAPAVALVAEDNRGRRNAILGGSMEDPIRALLHQQDADVEDGELEVDVQQEMFVLEPQEQAYTPSNQQVHRSPILEAIESDGEVGGEEICLSPAGFSMVMASFAVVIIVCSAAIICFCQKSKSLTSPKTDILYNCPTSLSASTSTLATSASSNSADLYRLRMYKI